jgi:hypothetical protein
MNYKVGDTVRIRSKEWIDAQDKSECGNHKEPFRTLTPNMFHYAGRIAIITEVAQCDIYKLDVDDGIHWWLDWMFDPDYRADGPLSAEDAIRAMLDGKALCDESGRECLWDSVHGWFAVMCNSVTALRKIDCFTGLYRRPEKRKRLMTRFEILGWTTSEASRGWVVRPEGNDTWHVPQFFSYDLGEYRFQRARILPDLSGVDEDTIQGFEVEE